jgi:uncharacterized cupredoxin-like copper-binding protein
MFIRALVTAGVAAAAAGSTTAAPPKVAGNLVTITANNYFFEMPERLPAGLTTIRLVNKGTELHHAILVRLRDGKSLGDLQQAFQNDGPIPNWVETLGGPNTPGPGGTADAILNLEPGRYAVICIIPSADHKPHIAKGMSRAFEVVGPVHPSVEPKADVTLTLSDYDFQLSRPLKAGRQLVEVVNGRQQTHEALIVKLAPGKSPQDFLGWVDKPQGPPPVLLSGGVTPLSPGKRLLIDFTFTPGSYALICFVPDIRDGAPHFVHGMVKTFEIAAERSSAGAADRR